MPKRQRSLKNYLLDRSFQLKYTSMLVGIAIATSVVLGTLLFRSSSQVIEQGQKTVDRGKLLIVQSRHVSQVVAMNIAKEYRDDPELAKTFGEAASRDEQNLNDEQKRLESDEAFLISEQRHVLLLLVGMFAVLVVGIGAFGIVFTHRVAGPIFKMKRLLLEVGAGKLTVRERLRRGDELHDFFQTFEQMVKSLRERQEAELAHVDRILQKLEAAPVSVRGTKEVDADGIDLLMQLRQEMQHQLDG
jgi:nitrogen fixation/metabolism regulation signal transduction histidine kinase